MTPLMKYGPTSEQEVVVLFALLLQHLPMRLELEEVREQFPDCLATRIEPDGTRTGIRIEFELYTSNFRAHGHDPEGCDLIVCWEDDIPDFVVPRLELRPIAEALTTPIIALPVKFKYEATVWKESTFLSECPIADLELHKELLGWARQRGEVVFGKGAKEASWTFQLRQAGSARGCTLFGVHANGTIWPIWKNLPAPIAGRFTKGLCESPQFRTAISAGKLWCNAKLRDEGMLATLQASVNGCL